jgi:beta-phosphoglucomutase
VPDVERRTKEYGDRKQAMIVELIEAKQFEEYPDALRFVLKVKEAGILIAAASSSKNAGAFLRLVRLDEFAEREGLSYGFLRPGYTLLDILDGDVSGRDFERGKPDPDIFLAAAEELALRPQSASWSRTRRTAYRRPRRARCRPSGSRGRTTRRRWRRLGRTSW